MSEAVLIAVGTGLVSAIGTVVAMRTDVSWLKRGLERLEQAIDRAHSRIDALEDQIMNKPGH